MGTDENQTPAPTRLEKLRAGLRKYAPTFAPLGPAVLITSVYLVFYAALANCSIFEVGCKTLPTRELLQERGLCPTAGGANVQPQAPARL